MSVLQIVEVPDPVLRKKAAPEKEFDADLERLALDMAETMYAAPGVGLAANQVGVLKQIIVIDTSAKDEPKNLLVLVNPEIVEAEGLEGSEEGCLSLPDFKQVVDRASEIKVRARDVKGNEIEISARDMLARAIQHECDHLHGRLLCDYSNAIKREFYLKKRKKLAKKS